MEPSPNGSIPYFLPPSAAQGLANYPHARLAPTSTTATRTLYISGTSSRRGDGTYAGCTAIPSDSARPQFSHNIREQTAAVLQNIGNIIKGATEGKFGLESVVDATVFLTNMDGDYAGMNDEWNKVWTRNAAPARTCVQVGALPGGGRLCVEIKCTAVVPA